MIKYLYALIGLFLFSFSTNAQQFINGSLEPVKSGLTTCSANPVSNYDTNMGSSWSVGPVGPVFLADSNCTAGHAFAGNHYIGLTYNSGGNYIVFALNAPMIAGTSYTLDFYYEFELGKLACPLYYGYSHSATSLDTVVGHITAPATNNWQLTSQTFTPLVSASYIWIGADMPGAFLSGVTYIDSLHMRGIPNVGVNQPEFGKGISIAPNPFSGSTKLSIDASVALPCNITVYDITGRVVWQKQNINTQQAIIMQDDMHSGMYFLKITDKNNTQYCTKLMVQ